MTVSLRAAAASHSDHRHWKNDLEIWANDISNWRKEHDDALAALEQISHCIREQVRSLDEHEESLQSLADTLEYHERDLAASMQAGSSEDRDDELQALHEQQARLHVVERAAHERIKRHHHRSMAQVAIMKAAIESQL